MQFVLVNAQGQAREVGLSTASADANQRLATMFAFYELPHLRPFLVRDHVYRTAHARAEWEPSARENLARELTRLAG